MCMGRAKRKPKRGTARNYRSVVYKYLPDEKSDVKSVAVMGGRCYKCNKITIAYCDNCQRWVCEKHMVKSEKDKNECFCSECSEKKG